MCREGDYLHECRLRLWGNLCVGPKGEISTKLAGKVKASRRPGTVEVEGVPQEAKAAERLLTMVQLPRSRPRAMCPIIFKSDIESCELFPVKLHGGSTNRC